MRKSKAASKSFFFQLTDSSDDSDLDETKKFKGDIKDASKISKSNKNTRGQSAIRKREKSIDIKERPKSSNQGKGNLSMVEFRERVSDKATTLKKKRPSVNPIKVQDQSLLNVSTMQKQLQENHNLKVKMNIIQKSIAIQEKAIKEMHKKIVNEKSDLSDLKERITQKEQKEKVANEDLKQEKSVVKSERKEKSRKKPTLVKKKEGLGLKEKENNHKSDKDLGPKELSYENIKQLHRNYFSEKPSESAMKDRRNELLKEEESILQRNRIAEMKLYMKDLTKKYELEIDQLKAEINSVTDENQNLRNKALSMKDQAKIEEQNENKIKDVEEMIRGKDREIAEKEGYYKGQIEDIHIKIEELQREIQRMGDCGGKVQELTHQMSLKEQELQLSKKYYMEKLQMKIDDQTRQKKEWINVYNELVSEIRNLKREGDAHYDIKNKKLTSNCSSIRSKEELTYS